jgi:hypothetical protein
MMQTHLPEVAIQWMPHLLLLPPLLLKSELGKSCSQCPSSFKVSLIYPNLNANPDPDPNPNPNPNPNPDSDPDPDPDPTMTITAFFIQGRFDGGRGKLMATIQAGGGSIALGPASATHILVSDAAAARCAFLKL